jgi:hypothetical protein
MVIGNGTFDILQVLGSASIPPAGNPGSASNP